MTIELRFILHMAVWRRPWISQLVKIIIVATTNIYDARSVRKFAIHNFNLAVKFLYKYRSVIIFYLLKDFFFIIFNSGDLQIAVPICVGFLLILMVVAIYIRKKGK